MPSFSVVLVFTHYGLTVPDLRVAKAFAPAKVSRFYTVVSVLSRSFIRVNIVKISRSSELSSICVTTHLFLDDNPAGVHFVVLQPVSAE